MPTIAARNPPVTDAGILLTTRLRLVPITAGDVDDVAAIADDWLVVREAPTMPYPYDQDTARRWISDAVRGRLRGTDHVFILRRRDDDRCVGAIGLQTAQAAAEIGYWLGREFWGSGYATEGVAAVLNFARSTLSVRRVEARVFVENAASARVLEKLGFERLRTERHYFANRGGLRRVQRFRLQAESDRAAWPWLKAAFRRLESGVGSGGMQGSREGP
jgi:8-oxo-dGTP diphosphatase